MNIPVLTQLVLLIEEVLKAHGPAVAQSVEQAAATAALASAEQDPKVQAVTAASVTLLQAAQGLKEAMHTPPPAADVTPVVAPAPETPVG